MAKITHKLANKAVNPEVKIREFRTGDSRIWDKYVLNHPRVMAYHLSAWKRAVESAYGFKSHYLIAYDELNIDKIKGVLPLIVHHSPLSINKALVSLPYCDAAGPLGDNRFIESKLLLAAFDLAHQKGIYRISIRSGERLPGFDKKSTLNRGKVRMVLKLGKDSDTLIKGFKAKLRSQIKKPMRDGLTAKIGGPEFLDGFYPLFSENMRDLGSPVHSRKWLKAVLSEYKNRAHLILVAMPDGKIAAGGVLLTCGRSVSVPWASSLRRYNRWNPNMLLYWTFLKYASDMGYTEFDFGRSTMGEGTYRFKKQWGAKPSPLHWADFDPSGNMYAHPTQVSKNRELAAAVIMKAPVSAATILGTAARRYISL